MAVTQMIMRARPELLPATLRDARQMARGLDGVWNRLDEIVMAAARLTQPSSINASQASSRLLGAS